MRERETERHWEGEEEVREGRGRETDRDRERQGETVTERLTHAPTGVNSHCPLDLLPLPLSHPQMLMC